MVGFQKLSPSNSSLNHSNSKVHENNQAVAVPRLLAAIHFSVAFYCVSTVLITVQPGFRNYNSEPQIKSSLARKITYIQVSCTVKVDGIMSFHSYVVIPDFNVFHVPLLKDRSVCDNLWSPLYLWQTLRIFCLTVLVDFPAQRTSCFQPALQFLLCLNGSTKRWES